MSSLAEICAKVPLTHFKSIAPSIFKTLHSSVRLMTFTMFCRLWPSNFVSSLTRIKSILPKIYNPYVSLGADPKKVYLPSALPVEVPPVPVSRHIVAALKNPSSDFYFFRRREFNENKNFISIFPKTPNRLFQVWVLTMDQAFQGFEIRYQNIFQMQTQNK